MDHTLLSCGDILHDIRSWQADHYDITAVSNRLGARDNVGTFNLQFVQSVFVDIKNRNAMTGLHEIACHRQPHLTYPDKTKVFNIHLICAQA